LSAESNRGMSVTLIVLQTQRLYVRPWLESDLEPLRRLLTDPQVARLYCANGRPAPESEIRSVWEWGLRTRSGHEPGFFNCPVVYRETGAVIGRAGINPLWTPERGPDPNEPELEWAFLPACWGQGLATELGRALIKYGFDVAGLDHMIAFTAPEHAASIRVMQKIGMTFDRQVPIRGEEAIVYRIDRTVYEVMKTC
jgi:RimJ/RimL family protein N-acetyltransferase